MSPKLREYPYWSVDVPGLDEIRAEELRKRCLQLGLDAELVDPSEFVTLHLPEPLVGALVAHFASQELAKGSPVANLAESLEEDLEAMRGLSSKTNQARA
ncbi:hypothetical protein [Frondihabitans peucedani]|jgi:hypothetical protein